MVCWSWDISDTWVTVPETSSTEDRTFEEISAVSWEDSAIFWMARETCFMISSTSSDMEDTFSEMEAKYSASFPYWLAVSVNLP